MIMKGKHNHSKDKQFRNDIAYICEISFFVHNFMFVFIGIIDKDFFLTDSFLQKEKKHEMSKCIKN